jgi:hypothetical protein
MKSAHINRMKASTCRFLVNTTGRFGVALLLPLVPMANADDVSYNTGSLGTVGNGTNSLGFGTVSVLLDQPGAVNAPGDFSSYYSGGNVTKVPFLSQLNPVSSSPFTIEFWANPPSSSNNNAPVSNRVSAGNRSGWVFFQRDAATGWNFRMYNGAGSATGCDITGGTATLNAWSQVVAVWDGANATLYVNGTSVASASSVTYNASTSAIFCVGNISDSNSGFTGLLDEVAFYPAALTATQILNHFNAVSSPVPGAYSSQVLADGAVEYLQQNPPVVSIAKNSLSPQVTYTGILSYSTNLVDWADLNVTSPYTPPKPLLNEEYFRSHR